MEITIKINGSMVSVEVSGEVADCYDQFQHKAENLSHEKRRHWDDREFDEYIVATEGHLPYCESPEQYVCRMETRREILAVLALCTEKQRERFLLHALYKEERNARSSRLCLHGAILEGVFPATITTDGETIKEFLIEISLLPGARELTEKMLNAGDEG